MNKHVIVSRYKDNINWVNKLTHPYTIIDKENTSNVGNEAWSYIRFLIDNYYNLPDRMLFVHGHENSYHQDYPTWYIANNLNWNLEFMNINSRRFEEQYISLINDFEDNEHNYRKSYESWIKTPWKHIFDQFPIPHTLTFLGHAQFLVSKNYVLRHPIHFYKHILNWLETTNIDRDLYTGKIEHFNKNNAYVSARILEYTWHYVFTGDPEEQLGNYLL
jgi:hypothetical protein